MVQAVSSSASSPTISPRTVKNLDRPFVVQQVDVTNTEFVLQFSKTELRPVDASTFFQLVPDEQYREKLSRWADTPSSTDKAKNARQRGMLLAVTVCHIVVCVVMWYEFELMVRFDSVREMLPTRQHSAQ